MCDLHLNSAEGFALQCYSFAMVMKVMMVVAGTGAIGERPQRDRRGPGVAEWFAEIVVFSD